MRVVDGAGRFIAPERRRLGYVPQDGALFPHLTVRRMSGSASPAMAAKGDTVGSCSSSSGLGGFGKRYPHELSGGEQQRVALARALAIDPKLVVLDEPFSSLDAALRQSVRSEVQAILRRTATTALLVTHDQEEALSLADRVAILRDGRIVQHGTPEELYETPVDEQLAAFLGAASVIDGTREGARVRTAVGLLPCSTQSDGGLDGSPVRVLLRPEHLELAASTESGLRGEVIETQYLGSASIVRVRPAQPCGCDVIVAKVEGFTHHAPGGTVTLTARGPVFAWDRQPEAGGPA